jgi:pimeloyl-ACP methyl ester carboxylesterase
MSRVVSKDGTTIAYDKVGSGPAVILVPPAMQYRAADPSVADLAGRLAARFTVISYDRRGRGESDDTLPYAVEREVEDIAALIAVAGGRVSLFGHSSGAILAIEAAASGLPVDLLALYEPPFTMPGARPAFPPDYVESLDRHLAAGDRSAVAEIFFTSGVGIPPEQVAGMKQSPFWDFATSVAHTLPYDARIVAGGFANGAFPDRWRGLALPVLVVDGDATMPYMHPAADGVAAFLPNASRKTLPGQDHGPRPDVLAPVLLEFFSN